MKATLDKHIAITPRAGSFRHVDACRVFDLAVRTQHAKTVVVDLKHAADAETSAFARLVLLRRALLRVGRDLRLCGLHGRVSHLFRINRLADVLPVVA